MTLIVVPPELGSEGTGLGLSDADELAVMATTGDQKLLAVYRDGVWSRDPSVLRRAPGGIFPVFSNEHLVGIDATGETVWTAKGLTEPALQTHVIGSDGGITVADVCTSQADAAGCTEYALVGVDTDNGELLWALPGFRLVSAHDNGYLLANDDSIFSPAEMRTLVGSSSTTRPASLSASQQWADPETFRYGCCGESKCLGLSRRRCRHRRQLHTSQRLVPQGRRRRTELRFDPLAGRRAEGVLLHPSGREERVSSLVRGKQANHWRAALARGCDRVDCAMILRSPLRRAMARSARVYDQTVNPDAPNNAHSFMLGMIGHTKRVIEFGCGTGHVTKVMHERGCRVTGLEIDPEAAQQAERYAERILVVDLDLDDFAAKLSGEEFDVALFGDVLEHVRGSARSLAIGSSATS